MDSNTSLHTAPSLLPVPSSAAPLRHQLFTGPLIRYDLCSGMVFKARHELTATIVSQANDPIFCVVADRSFRVGSLVGGTGVHRQLGDDLMSDGGLGVEWRITAEAVTTSLQQGKQNNTPSHSCTHPLTRSHHRQTRTSTLKHTHTHPHTRTHTNTEQANTHTQR
jgi:hypothetical protein